MLEFALQLGEKFVSLGNRRVQNFDRYPLPRAGQIETILIQGVEYGAHAAMPQHSPNPVASTQQVADRHFPSDFCRGGARNRYCLSGRRHGGRRHGSRSNDGWHHGRRFDRGAHGGRRNRTWSKSGWLARGRRDRTWRDGGWLNRGWCNRFGCSHAWGVSLRVRLHMPVAVECRALEAGFDRVEEVCLYLSAVEILVQQRQDFPTLIRVCLGLLVHRIQKCVRRANTARQGIQPQQSRTFGPRARLRPAGRLCPSRHIANPRVIRPQDLMTGDDTEDSGSCVSCYFYNPLSHCYARATRDRQSTSREWGLPVGPARGDNCRGRRRCRVKRRSSSLEPWKGTTQSVENARPKSFRRSYGPCLRRRSQIPAPFRSRVSNNDLPRSSISRAQCAARWDRETPAAR